MTCPNPTPDVNCHYGARVAPLDKPLTTRKEAMIKYKPRGMPARFMDGAPDVVKRNVIDILAIVPAAPLWYVADQDGNSQFLRARSREDAKAKIRAEWPDARFFR